MRMRRWAPLLVLLLILGLSTPVRPATAAGVPAPAATALPVPLPPDAAATAVGTLGADGTGRLNLGTLPAGDYNLLVEIPGGDPMGYRVVDDSLAAVTVSQDGGGAQLILRAGEAVWQHVQVTADSPLTLTLHGGPRAGALPLAAAAVPVPEVDRAGFSGLAPFAGHRSTVAVHVATAGFYHLDLHVGGNLLSVAAAGTRLHATVVDEQSPAPLYLPAGLQEISLSQQGGGRPWAIALSGPVVTVLPLLFDSQVRPAVPASVAFSLGNRRGPVQARLTVLALGLSGTQVSVSGGPVNRSFTIGAAGHTAVDQNISIDPGSTLQLDIHVQLADYVRQVCGPVCDQQLPSFVVIVVDNAQSYTPPVVPDLQDPPAFNPRTGDVNQGWFTEDVSFSLQGDPDALARTEVSGDGVHWYPYDPSQPFQLTEDGIYDLYWRTDGLAGNGELPNRMTVKLDKTGPRATQVELSSPAPRNADGSYNAPVTVTFRPQTDPASLAPGAGLFSLDGFQTTAYDAAGPISFWTPGTYTLTVRAVDTAGQEEQPQTLTFRIAGTPPPGAGTYVLATAGDVPAQRIPTLHQMLQRAWEQDTSALGYRPTSPILVEFLGNREEWTWQLAADGNGLSTVSIVSGAGGLTVFGGGHIEIPLDNDPAAEPPDGSFDDGDLQNTITHEMFHAILGKSGDDQAVPTWANEGTAWQSGNAGQLPFTGGGQPYAAGSFLSARNTILNANKYGGFVPLSRIDVLASFWNTEAYSYLAIARLEQKLGIDKWINYLHAAAAGQPDALRANLGLTQQQVDDDLRQWVNQQSSLPPGLGRVSLRLLPALGPARLGFTAAGSGQGGVDTGWLDPGDYTFYVQADGTVWGPPGVTFSPAQHPRDYDRLTVSVTPRDVTYKGKRLSRLDFYLRQSYGQWYLSRYELFFDDGTALPGPFQPGADLAGLVHLHWIDTLDLQTLQPRDGDVITLGITSPPPALDLRAYLNLDQARAVAGSDGAATVTGTAQPGAAVWASGLGVSTHADATGHFSLQLPVEAARDVLIMSSLPVPLPPAVAAVQLVPAAGQ